MIRLSVILPTTGRETLAFAAACASGQLKAGDELIIVGGGAVGRQVAQAEAAHWIDHAPGGDWGGRERMTAMQVARGSHLLFVDDDDALLPEALEEVREALAVAPDRPHIFSMLNIDGRVLPAGRVVAQGNIGTPQLIAPNVASKLGQWGTRYEGDYDFIVSTLAHYPDGPIWHDAVIYGCREYGRQAWSEADV